MGVEMILVLASLASARIKAPTLSPVLVKLPMPTLKPLPIEAGLDFSSTKLGPVPLKEVSAFKSPCAKAHCTPISAALVAEISAIITSTKT